MSLQGEDLYSSPTLQWRTVTKSRFLQIQNAELVERFSCFPDVSAGLNLVFNSEILQGITYMTVYINIRYLYSRVIWYIISIVHIVCLIDTINRILMNQFWYNYSCSSTLVINVQLGRKQNYLTRPLSPLQCERADNQCPLQCGHKNVRVERGKLQQ